REGEGVQPPEWGRRVRTEAAAAGVRDESRLRSDGSDFAVPQPPQLEEPALVPREIRPPRRIAWIVRARQVQPAGGAEVLLAMLAVAHARAGPSVAEDAVHVVARN